MPLLQPPFCGVPQLIGCSRISSYGTQMKIWHVSSTPPGSFFEKLGLALIGSNGSSQPVASGFNVLMNVQHQFSSGLAAWLRMGKSNFPKAKFLLVLLQKEDGDWEDNLQMCTIGRRWLWGWPPPQWAHYFLCGHFMRLWSVSWFLLIQISLLQDHFNGTTSVQLKKA